MSGTLQQGFILRFASFVLTYHSSSWKKGQKELKSWETGRRAPSSFSLRHSHCDQELTAAAVTCTRSAPDWPCWQSVMNGEWDRAALLLPVDRAWLMGNHCPQLYTHWWTCWAPMVQIPWLFRWSWLNSVGHKTKQQDMNMGNIFIGKKQVWQEWEKDKRGQGKNNQNTLYKCVK